MTARGMQQPASGTKVIMQLLFETMKATGHHFDSEGRSPLDRYRSLETPASLADDLSCKCWDVI